MNYSQELTTRLDEKIPGNDVALLRIYVLLALAKGTDMTLENVHDAWAIWKDGIKPDHKSLIPFGELTEEVQELDRKYMDAIVELGWEIQNGVA